MAKPFLKWPGGKAKLVPELLKHIPPRYGVYHETFVGAGALFFALQPDIAMLSDANPFLMKTYEGVQRHVENVIGLLQQDQMHHSEEHYYHMRGRDVSQLGPAAVAAWMIYLNKTCFNGLWRVNKKGQFNVPLGDYKNPNICDVETLRAAWTTLNALNVSVACADFRTVEERIQRDDLVYFDPPYVPVSETANFTSYTKDGFGPKDQQDLFDVAHRLKKKGVHVILSNACSDEVAKIYRRDFTLHEVACRRNINSKASARGPVKEYIIT